MRPVTDQNSRLPARVYVVTETPEGGRSVRAYYTDESHEALLARLSSEPAAPPVEVFTGLPADHPYGKIPPDIQVLLDGLTRPSS